MYPRVTYGSASGILPLTYNSTDVARQREEQISRSNRGQELAHMLGHGNPQRGFWRQSEVPVRDVGRRLVLRRGSCLAMTSHRVRSTRRLRDVAIRAGIRRV